jgi:hypothetical protein
VRLDPYCFVDLYNFKVISLNYLMWYIRYMLNIFYALILMWGVEISFD